MQKSTVFSAFTIFLFGLLALRLVQLQLLEYDKYQRLAKNNTTKQSIVRAPRGIVYDRQGRILATSKQSLSVMVYPFQLRDTVDQEKVATMLADFLSINYEDLLKKFTEMDPTTPLPLTLDNDISLETAVKIFENRERLPGIQVERQALRYYPFGNSAAHLLGYVGELSASDAKRKRFKGLHLGDIVGKDGLEKYFDADLRGINGEKRAGVDRFGKLAEPNKFSQDPLRGSDLYLTIDINLQQVAEEAMRKAGIKGAAVVLNPQNGEIYALVSEPSFDPNIFTKPVPTKLYRELANKKAFFNRAISSYTPGSIWKPVSAIAAIEHDVTSGHERLQVGEQTVLGDYSFGDWTGKKEIMDLKKALAWSRNTYFYQIAKRMKPDWIAEQGRKMGAGKKTGVEILGESDGLVPDPHWKKKKLKEVWFPGNTLHLSIGQSFLLVSPLQAAKIISTIATGGRVPKPHLVKNTFKEAPERVIAIEDQALEIVRDGLRECVSSGTGQAARLSKVTVAGKTGSAEVGGYKHSTHAWFVAYAPAEPGSRAELALAIIGEGAGHGGAVAAPIAKKILEAYFDHHR